MLEILVSIGEQRLLIDLETSQILTLLGKKFKSLKFLYI